MHETQCPQCHTPTPPRWSEGALRGQLLYYKCRNDDCRCHFCARHIAGVGLQVLHASKLKAKPGPRMGAADVKCVDCGEFTRQVTSGYRPSKQAFNDKEEGAYRWRRHECLTHGATHSYEYVDGTFEVTKKLRAKHAGDHL